MVSHFTAVVLLLLPIISDGAHHWSWKEVIVNSYSCVRRPCSVGGTCCDLKEALRIAEDEITIIVQTDSHFSTPMEICNKRGLYIRGSFGHDAAKVDCSSEFHAQAGLGFYNVTDLHIDNLCLIGCGGIFNFSICFVGFSIGSTPPAALHIYQSKNIRLSAITIAHSIGNGMTIERSTGLIVLQKMVLFDNAPHSDRQREYPRTGGGMTIVLNKKGALVYVTQCFFANNQVIVYSQLDNGL